jgi:exosortase A-associated hydrolase 2
MTAAGNPIRLNVSGRLLFGMLHRADDASPSAVVLVVHPFAEEKKFSYRVLVGLARELARRGVATLRFDLSGCGDSPGESSDATLADWQHEVRAASEHLGSEFHDSPQVLVGLRLGATLALSVVGSISPMPRLVLWEPILSGRTYVDAVLRRRMIKEMMTTGRKATGREQVLAQLGTDGFLDLDGIAVSRRMIEDISSLDAQVCAEGFSANALLVQIAFNAKVSSELESLAETMRAAGADVTALGIREQAFWDRVEGVEAKELIDLTCDWIAKK